MYYHALTGVYPTEATHQSKRIVFIPSMEDTHSVQLEPTEALHSIKL